MAKIFSGPCYVERYIWTFVVERAHLEVAISGGESYEATFERARVAIFRALVLWSRKKLDVDEFARDLSRLLPGSLKLESVSLRSRTYRLQF